MENRIDWKTLLLFAAILIFGWFNIYAACYDEMATKVIDFANPAGKQLIWIGLSLVFAMIILLIDPKLISSLSYVIYLVIIVLLVVTLFVGTRTKGGQSWIDLGLGFKFQATEFAKFATALALSRFISTLGVDYKQPTHKLMAWLIILVPVALTLLQHDTGSALVFAGFVLPLFREGMSPVILVIGIVAIILFVVTLLINKYIVIGILALLGIFYLYVWLNKRTRKDYLRTIALFLVCSLFVFSVNIVFENVLKSHQRERIFVLLGKTDDTSGSGYNVHQSKIAIGSGGLFGKGYLNGTLTKADFVPEQETDFIFCTVGEEWGFLGSTLLIAAYILLLLRIVTLAERQYSRFTRFYGYSVASILFIHVFINIGMVLGLLPVIGIPLPFFSYGGSSLMAFTIMIFIFIRQDQDRTNPI